MGSSTEEGSDEGSSDDGGENSGSGSVGDSEATVDGRVPPRGHRASLRSARDDEGDTDVAPQASPPRLTSVGGGAALNPVTPQVMGAKVQAGEPEAAAATAAPPQESPQALEKRKDLPVSSGGRVEYPLNSTAAASSGGKGALPAAHKGRDWTANDE